jgi:glycerol-3-phosphate dehydrogenase
MALRSEKWAAIQARPDVPVLIIGAGVNGIGTFRDLALQGVDVLMVDKGDYCSGASAASSHMLHGGIRYLENGEFRLVREALTERNLMLKNAPHYAKPLPTSIPIFSVFSGFLNAPLKFLRLREKPTERGAAVIKLGLVFYDLFARKHRVMPKHRVIRRKDALKEYPGLRPDVKYVARYYDAWMPYPERICLEMVQDAEAAHPGARALNYVAVVGAGGDSVQLRDEVTGKSIIVKPKIVINAAGPWIDATMRAIGKETKFIGGTKGSHLILDNPELHAACNGGEFFFENEDGRIVLIMPYIDGKVMVGTTDIRIDDPEQAVCTDEETDYMLNLVNRILPGIKVDKSQIVFKFSGVRPLPNSDKGYTGNVSRDHEIETTEPDAILKFPVLSLIGGKWTTFRAFSEQAADLVLKRLGMERKVSTANRTFGGGKDYPKDPEGYVSEVAEDFKVKRPRAQQLFDRYGTRALYITNFIVDGEDAPLKHNPKYSRRELQYLLTTEHITHLDDLLLRRTLIAWLGGFTPALLQEVADIAAASLGWDEGRKSLEIQRARDILSRKHGLTLSNGA